MARTLKQHIFARQKSLREAASMYHGDWRDCSDFVLGARGRFLPGDADAGDENQHRRNERLYNETPKQAAHTLASGMVAGITSPARPWFKLGPPDPEMEEYEPVKLWLDAVQKVLLSVFARSNFYSSIHSTYLELGTFGTNAIGAYEDFANVMRYEPYTIGSFMIAADGKRGVDTLYRQYRSTVGDIIKKFGKDTPSQAIINLWDRGDYEEKATIIHAIEPNIDRDFDSPLSRDMPWRSVYYEEKCDGERALGESGFNEKPFMAPRWETTAEDVYATSYPGIDCLASNKSLQIEELDLAIAREKMHNPALIGDASLQQHGADLIAGGISFVPNMAQTGKPGLAPIYEVNPRVEELNKSIAIKEHRIERFFYADLFLMITEMDRAQITATEIAERKEEKMLMLGPVLERLNNELLDPIIDRTYARCEEAGMFPPPPPELDEVDLKVEYISILAQAQKAVSTASIESTVTFAANLAPVWPEARHKIDPMQAIDEYARAKGASPKILRSDDDANEASDAEQQQIQAQQAAAMGGGAVDAAKTLSDTEVNGDPMLDQMLAGLN